MAHFEESKKGSWQACDPLIHLATHTPIQARQIEGVAPGAFHSMAHQGAWRFTPSFVGGITAPQPPILRQPWQQTSATDWASAANNNTKVDWEKWSPSAEIDVPRPMAQLGTIMTSAPLPSPSPIMPKIIDKDDAMDHDPAYSNRSLKEEERQSSENTASYDVSASQSPSDGEMEPAGAMERQSDPTEDSIDVDVDSATTHTPQPALAVSPSDHQQASPQKTSTDWIAANVKVEIERDEAEPEKMDMLGAEDHRENQEASKLLLNFSHQSFSNLTDALVAAGVGDSRNEFVQSNNSAFSNPDQPKSEEASTSTISHDQAGSSSSNTTSNSGTSSISTTTTSSSFCRPPGLGPSLVPTPTGQGMPLVCPICGFSSNSKFHYNSHMNTHGDHQCSMCDYTSRTEGRLKKHMRESHTVEEQLAVGLEIESRDASSTPTTSSAASSISTTSLSSCGGASSPSAVSSATATIVSSSPFADTSSLSTTMASLVDAANAAAAQAGNSLPESNIVSSIALSLAENLTSSSLLNTMAPMLQSTALDQIRVLTEKSPILNNENSVNLANALGAMVQIDEVANAEVASTGGSSNAGNTGPSGSASSGNAEPRRNSNGKIKQLKCKQCPHISYSKDDQWAHARTHIPADKQMNCPKCNFVTEYKHHLEYHIRNHLGSKPFQCKKCSYQCVNKSMLNSHMKSHTNVYQFRCMDCTYATKYCHSLKLHLRKYEHRRVPEGVDVGDPSPGSSSQNESAGTSNSYQVNQFQNSSPSTSLAQSLGLATPIVTSQSLNYASQMLLRQHQMEQQLNLINGLAGLSQQFNCSICEFQTTSQEDLMRHNVSHLMSGANSQSPIVSLYQSLPQMSGLLPSVPSIGSADADADADEQVNVDTQNEDESGHVGDDEMDGSSGSTNSPMGSSKGGNSSADEGEPRKRKGFKVDQIGERLLGKSPSASECGSHCEDKETEERMEASSTPSEGLLIAQPQAQQPSLSSMPVSSAFSQLTPDNKLSIFQQACLAQLSNVLQEQAMYQIHMGYHGYEHPFKCNRCGYVATDALTFNLHLLQASHE